MKREEIAQNNKLIAEFMEEVIDGDRILCFEPHGQYRQMNYHASWDWLMPVVEKIERLYSEKDGIYGVYIYSNGCTIQGTKFRSDTNSDAYFLQMDGKTKIEATYNAVCAFIEWHDQQHSPAIVDRSEKPGGAAEDL